MAKRETVSDDISKWTLGSLPTLCINLRRYAFHGYELLKLRLSSAILFSKILSIQKWQFDKKLPEKEQQVPGSHP